MRHYLLFVWALVLLFSYHTINASPTLSWSDFHPEEPTLTDKKEGSTGFYPHNLKDWNGLPRGEKERLMQEYEIKWKEEENKPFWREARAILPKPAKDAIVRESYISNILDRVWETRRGLIAIFFYASMKRTQALYKATARRYMSNMDRLWASRSSNRRVKEKDVFGSSKERPAWDAAAKEAAEQYLHTFYGKQAIDQHFWKPGPKTTTLVIPDRHKVVQKLRPPFHDPFAEPATDPSQPGRAHSTKALGTHEDPRSLQHHPFDGLFRQDPRWLASYRQQHQEELQAARDQKLADVQKLERMHQDAERRVHTDEVRREGERQRETMHNPERMRQRQERERREKKEREREARHRRMKRLSSFFPQGTSNHQ